MPKELEYRCEGGRCTWRWNANQFETERVTLRVRRRDGTSELRDVANSGEIVLPEEEEVEEIVSTGRGARGRRSRWRGPGT